MAEKKGKRKRVIDKWKKKKWYKILAPKSFNQREIGETPSEKDSLVLNRVVLVSARDLGIQTKKQHLSLKFKVFDVQGLKAQTKTVQIEIKPSFLRRIIRRRSSKMEVNQTEYLKDGSKAKIKTVAISLHKLSQKKKKSIRKLLFEKVKAISKSKDFEELIQEIIFGTHFEKAFNEIKKIAPMKRVEIVKASLTEGK